MAAVQRAGHDVRLISCTDGPLVERAAAIGVRAVVVPMPAVLAATGESGGAVRALLRGLVAGPRFYLYARTLRRAICEVAADVVHSNGLKCHLLLGLAPPGVPVVWHLHDFVASRKLTARILRRASKRASRAIAISRAVEGDARGVLAPLPIDVVLNAIDVGHFAPQPTGCGSSPGAANPARGCVDLDGLAQLPPAAPDTIRVGLIATYARWKGQDCFLRAAARTLKDHPDVPLRFYVVGGAIYHTKGSQWSRDELEDLARELGVGDRVGFVGFQADAAPVYRALDVVCHASTRPEPFGLTIVEAMACRRATVVARAGGAADIATDGFDALTFTPGDDADLAARIALLATDPARRDLVASAARATAVNEYSDSRLGPELVAVYERALRRR
jgi:glycosyltransferase involved in cell wall biosynthesis